jgi:uncharacterized protein
MSITKQLYQLQETDLRIEADEETLKRLNAQLGDDKVLVKLQNELSHEQETLDKYKKEQHSVEWEVDDYDNKIKDIEKKLFDGSVKNPKELANLQAEEVAFKKQQDILEDKALLLIDKVEQAEDTVKKLSDNLNTTTAKWQEEQKQIAAEIEKLNTELSGLREQRKQQADRIDSEALETYRRLREKREHAVVEVKQGICTGCRITVSTAKLQAARGGNLVQCGSCSRILYIP